MENLDNKEQLKESKKLYHNWKTYAIGLGVVVIGSGAGVGIYYGVNANSSSITNAISNQDVANAIAGQTYQAAAVKVGSEPNSITNQITPNFIENNLADNIKNAFKAESFSLDSVTVVDQGATRALAKNDLTEARTFNATINYQYEAIAGLTTLKITVINSEPTAQEVVDAIAGQTYQATTTIGSGSESITNQITAQFIQSQLQGEIHDAFKAELFDLDTIKVMVGENELNASDLKEVTTTPITATINFDYAGIATTTNLDISVVLEFYNDQQIWQKIVDTKFKITIVSGAVTADDFNRNTLYQIINNQLPKEYQKDYDAKKIAPSVTYKDEKKTPINDTDLTGSQGEKKTFRTLFSYGSVVTLGEIKIEVTFTTPN